MYPRPDKRPVYLNLFQFRFPLNAIVSISHRISGVLLVLGFAVLLLWLNLLVFSSEPYAQKMAMWSHPLAKVFLSVFLMSLWFHWLSGARHLLMEHDVWGWLSDLRKSTASAQVMLWVFALGCAVIVWQVWA